MPALPITIEAARGGTSVHRMSSLIRPFNLSGHPALTLPVSVEGSSLKAGLQIVGRKGEGRKGVRGRRPYRGDARRMNTEHSKGLSEPCRTEQSLLQAPRAVWVPSSPDAFMTQAKVALADIAIDAAQALARELSRRFERVPVEIDVTRRPNSKRRAMRCSNAGADRRARQQRGRIESRSCDGHHAPSSSIRSINVNLRSVLFGCQVFGQYFADPGAGRIVNIASLAGTERRLGHGRPLCRRQRRRHYA